jgi:hypothetical protein
VPSSVRVTPGAVTVNISPLGFHIYACQFFRSARLARSHARKKFSPVPYYLYCRALELLLKAFLLSKGVSAKELKSQALGHDLSRCLKRANGEGLTAVFAISEPQASQLEMANAYYASKGFEYFNVANVARGYRNLPDLGALDALCSALADRLEHVCADA